MGEGKELGLALRRERERRGISLESVADTTKIGLALLTGLERGDLARWPTGIFRRAFIRAYAEAIGLSPDDVVPRFERAFPEPGDAVVVSPVFAARDARTTDPLRLSLALTPRERALAWLRRLAAFAVDLVAVAGAGTAAALATQQPPVAAMLAAAVLYFGLGTVLLETSPGTWALRRASRARHVTAARPAAMEPLGELPAPEPGMRRPDASAAPRPPHRDRRHVRAERRRVARPGQRPQ